MAAIDELIMADGTAHPAELEFRAELAALLEADLGIELEEDAADTRTARLSYEPQSAVKSDGATHPFFDAFEYHYAAESDRIAKQVAADRQLLDRVIELLARSRGEGEARREEVGRRVRRAGAVLRRPCLRDAAEARAARTSSPCWGTFTAATASFKAAIMQSRFFERVNAFRDDPENNPEPRLLPTVRSPQSPPSRMRSSSPPTWCSAG